MKTILLMALKKIFQPRHTQGVKGRHLLWNQSLMGTTNPTENPKKTRWLTATFLTPNSSSNCVCACGEKRETRSTDVRRSEAFRVKQTSTQTRRAKLCALRRGRQWLVMSLVIGWGWGLTTDGIGWSGSWVMEAIGRTGWRSRTVKMRQKGLNVYRFGPACNLGGCEHVSFVIFENI